MIYERILNRVEAAKALDEVQELVTAERFHARVVVQSRDGIERWHIEVDLPEQQWYAVSDKGSSSERRDGATFHNGEPVERETSLFDEAPSALELVFFDRLIWWGQSEQGFWPIVARRIGEHSVLVVFEHGADPSMLSALVVDTALGLVSRIMHFDSPYILLLDVEQGRGIERLVPTAWPELEVQYPMY